MKLHNLIQTLAICSLATCILLAACGKDRDDTESAAITGSTLSFFVMGNDSARCDVARGEVVGLTLWDAVSGHTYNFNKKMMVAEDASLVGEDGVVTYPEGATSLCVFANMPYCAEWSSADAYQRVEVNTNQSTYESYHASDFMVGRPRTGNVLTHISTTLQFEHSLSLLNFELLDPTEQMGLSEAVIMVTNVLTSAFVNPYTGDVSTLEGERSSILACRTLNSSKTRSNRRETLSVIIPPQTFEGNVSFLKVKVNNSTYTLPLYEMNVEGTTAGNQHNYTLELTPDGIRLLSCTVQKWTDGGVTNLMIAE